ncbi:hypothetical protein CSKR_104367 [Clonorchis sinensis]|uniref:Uncharacterized protein n=1 Tax=Clonorchis sinensis TaxID=79923 RepID=A0A419QDF7_CLOSI|nr:hypothetical protein CSKR_104367 [Clonorchis sinensis]
MRSTGTNDHLVDHVLISMLMRCEEIRSHFCSNKPQPVLSADGCSMCLVSPKYIVPQKQSLLTHFAEMLMTRAKLESSVSPIWCGLTEIITPEQEDDRSNESGVNMNNCLSPCPNSLLLWKSSVSLQMVL